MPAVSARQARFARMCEHADHPPTRCPKRGALKDFQHHMGKKKRAHTLKLISLCAFRSGRL